MNSNTVVRERRLEIQRKEGAPYRVTADEIKAMSIS
jgi:hypothetical protein